MTDRFALEANIKLFHRILREGVVTPEQRDTVKRLLAEHQDALADLVRNEPAAAKDR